MAEFLWTFAVQEVLKKAVNLAAQQVGLAWGFEKEMSKLRDSFLMVEAILRDIGGKKAEHCAVKLWVEKLDDVVFEADVLLDKLTYEGLRRKVKSQTREKVRNVISPFNNPFLFRLKMAKKIKAITNMLDKLYCEASAVGLVSVAFKETTELDLSQIRETDSFPEEFQVVGRETEISKIVNQVIDSCNQETISVIPIVGMGGLGKTTLAKLVFNHEVITEHFDKTIWVCVSEPFVVKSILRAILETVSKSPCCMDIKEAILQKLQTELDGKSYFLVLDDVWNEDCKMWSELKNCLLKTTRKSGNCILLTTRSDKVAEIVETLPRHQLQKLSDDQCWSLFKEFAHANGLPTALELDVIQRDIVKRIGGIPLVAKVLGGAVKFDGNYSRWISSLEILNKNRTQDEDLVLSTLKLSVDYLPSSSLKQCFAYCSNFQKDYNFRKEQLIRLWMAQGFLQPFDGSSVLMEDIGDNYFNILLSRSLFQDIVKDKRGRIIYCKMHDLIHDLACAISSSQRLQLDLKEESRIRELSLVDSRHKALFYKEMNARKFRTLIDDGKILHSRITRFAYLRVLILDVIYNLPDSIGKLKHLRYLDLKNSHVEALPQSVIMLYNLQTLMLGFSCKVLPKNLKNLVSLRHLEFLLNHHDPIKKMPPHLGRLIHLQTLSHYIVGFENGCKIQELGPLRNLRGTLRLLRLEHVKSREEAMATNLVEKENILDLYFEWSLSSKRESSSYNDLDVLEGLQPHKNLQFLSIKNFAGELLPNSIFVENLVRIELENCIKCEMLPMFGQLTSLEVLKISGLHSVRSIGNEFYGHCNNEKSIFPKLKILRLFSMKGLEHWKEVIDVSDGRIFPCLEELGIMNCPKLMNISNLFACPHERLEVDGVGVESSSSIQGLANLRVLDICGCEKLTELPKVLESCTSIEELSVGDCPNLTSILNLQNMRNLSCLRISNLRKLSAGLANLMNLKELEIWDCMQDFDLSPLIHLPSLKDLVLHDLGTSSTQLPQQLEHLTALRRLTIWNFHGIEALPEWLENLTALERLCLKNCRNLKHLPSMEAMRHLTKLKYLNVYRCPQLKLGEHDQERAKVSHVLITNVSY